MVSNDIRQCACMLAHLGRAAAPISGTAQLSWEQLAFPSAAAALHVTRSTYSSASVRVKVCKHASSPIKMHISSSTKDSGLGHQLRYFRAA